MTALSAGQKSLIHVAKAQLGLDQATYEAVLLRSAGVDSAAKLDQRGFGLVLEDTAGVQEHFAEEALRRPEPAWFRHQRADSSDSRRMAGLCRVIRRPRSVD